jgi:FlaA1/EpsC-like NDP-sugar epimerase
VLQAAAVGDGGNVFMLDMGEPVKIADLARDLIRLSHHSQDEIPVVFTGLRPGEKLFEEVRLQGESIKPTVHPQIVVTEPPQPPRHTVAAWLSEGDAHLLAPREEVIEWLVKLIPEYIRGEQNGQEAVAQPIAMKLAPTA